MTLSRRSLLATTAAAAAAAPLAVSAAREAGGSGSGHRPHHGSSGGLLRTGFERLADDGYGLLAGRKTGVVTNPTGITRDVRHIVDVMHADPRVRLTAVFGPEHGFRGTAQAGGSEGRYDDPATGLPVYDTYLKSGTALADVFTASGVDTVVFDIQDAGARFYTYIWTLYDCMEAAQLAGKRFVVLDRPNPVTGRAALGPVLHKEFATFVGRQPIAQAHGMTVAELARLFNSEFLAAPVPLETVTMTGWKRGDFYDASGLPWVPPSPNMPTADTALVYSGTCMFEGTNLSEGRGTTRPFELLGAEGVDGRWAAAANELALPGVRFREAYFAPTFSKFQGKTVGGVQIHVHDRAAFDPVRTGIALLVTAKKVWDGFAWRPDNWIDKLTGSTRVRTMIDAGAGTDEVTGAWQEELTAFRRVRKEYLLYG
ncbi:exo-beta-N-acetylmuramidase NamZ domain-containing protein [Streptomyces sp. NPDC090108]|uniref:exo-beta-N-acetylmuramidase NamZ family protein n=1 Tax=Streptomyces sp. NPDC090108 TaxID=3365947 RepID=UPI0037FDFC33